jgi:Flp pilus assembly protein TadG
MTSNSANGGRTSDEKGQIIVIFAIALVAMLVALALLFDGAQGMVLKRQLQNASDSGALAGANLLQANTIGCAASYTTDPPGSPRDTIATAVKNAIKTNLGWTDAKVATNVTITCPSGYGDNAVKVVIHDTSKTYFGGIAGITNMGVGATSVAFNGPLPPAKFSVMELNPGPPTTATWGNAYQGCPSVQFAGSAMMAFQGNVQSDSACLAAAGGSFGVNGNASTICFGTLNFTTGVCTPNGAILRMVGSWTQGPNVVTPAPLQFQPYVPDPLKSLHTLVTTGWTTNGGGNGTVIGNGSNPQCSILSPGIYNNGIEIKAQGSAYLLPGRACRAATATRSRPARLGTPASPRPRCARPRRRSAIPRPTGPAAS